MTVYPPGPSVRATSLSTSGCLVPGIRLVLALCVVTISLGLSLAAVAQEPSQDDASQAQQWQQCKTQLKETALARGIAAETVHSVFADIVQIPRVIAQDRKQAEFTKTFTQYYRARVTKRRVDQGRALLSQEAALFAQIQANTGVPPQYIVALWGLETNFGSYFGQLSIPSALATLACDSRRSEFFTKELVATLRIVDAGDIAAKELIGSWAGAIGHMQFMPTTYLAHAVDGDQDGRKDLLGSIPDALTSGAGYLAELGWQAGFRWGREVKLPMGFDYGKTGSHQWQPLRAWANLGVTDVFGHPLPALDLTSALLLPSGHTGPAFLVYPNFRILMKWNRSEHYAISVGRLADRIAGAGQLATPLPDVADNRLVTDRVFALQQALNDLGYNTGKADGILGPATRKAVQSFQQSLGAIADGYPTHGLIQTALSQAAKQAPAARNTQPDQTQAQQ